MTYQSKSIDSFNTRKRFYIFHKVIHGHAAVDQDEFLKFDVDSDDQADLVRCFLTEYYHLDGKKNLKSYPKCSLTINGIYSAMITFEEQNNASFNILKERYFNEVFKTKFTEAKYKELVHSRKCYYCGITVDEIEMLSAQQEIFKKNERGWVMEIDRKSPNKEYSNDNCVAACYWCNNAKTDEFNAVEFKPIGKEIGKALRNRLNK